MFLFLSLAFAKRYVELAQLTADGKIKNRDYYRVDAQMVGSLGAASGYLAALVFSLYVENGRTASAIASRACSGWPFRCCSTGSAGSGS